MSKEYDNEKKDLYWQITGLEHELKQYKDIEKELGIDLITLFKALKNGVWVKEDSEIIKKEVKDISYSKYISVHYKDENGHHDKLGALIIYYGDYNSQYVDFSFVYSYGKTWALTKEELE